MQKALLLSVVTAFATLHGVPAAAEAPFQLAVFDTQLPEAEQVSGVRVPVLYGKDGGNVRGLDVQLLAYSEMKSLSGIAFPLLVGGANRISGDMNGVALGLFNWHQGQDTGLNLGFANVTNNVKGLNWGVVNVADGYTVADVGIVSVSQKSDVQVSFVNVTKELGGLQIGLINCAKNGFLPCFPLVNFPRR